MAQNFPILGYVTFALLQTLMPGGTDLVTIVTQLGVAGLLFYVWRSTHTTSVKQQAEMLQQIATSQTSVLTHMGDQFSSIFTQMKTIHENSVAQNEATVNRLFSVMHENQKYISMVAEILSRMEEKIDSHKKGN